MSARDGFVVSLLILIVAIVAFCLVALWLLFPPTVSGSIAPAKYDHSNCQYPARWSNPPDGCDNSDPAVPECVAKSTTQLEETRCIDAFVKKHNDPEPITSPKVAPVGSQKQSTPKCTE